MTQTLTWEQCVGAQRDWVWRGWQTRYSYINATQTDSTAPPILFLHGFGASIGHWKHNLPFFSEHHTVYALDLLGFGGSEKANINYLASLWAEQVYDFWRTFVNVPVILVGNSLGSVVSIIAAARYPQMVCATVMVNLPDSSVIESPPWLKYSLALIKSSLFPVLWVSKAIFTSSLIFEPFFRWLRRPNIIRFWVQKAYARPHAVTDELVDLLVKPTHDRGASRALRAMFNAKPTRKAEYLATHILPRLTIPMLLIWGRQDMMVPPKLGPLFVKQNKAIQLVELDNAGHCPQDECPEDVNVTIATWINDWLPNTYPLR